MDSVSKSFLPLGFVSFGGPTGNIGMMERVFVDRFKAMTPEKFSEILGICSVLPGSTSLQLATALGTQLAGIPGGLVALILFSWPGLVLMLLAGSYLGFADSLINRFPPGWVYAAAISVMAVASLSLFQRVCKSTLSVVLSVVSAVTALTVAAGAMPLIPISSAVIAALVGTAAHTQAAAPLGTTLLTGPQMELSPVSMMSGQISLGLLVVLGLAMYFFAYGSDALEFYLAGGSIFGGGSAIIPYLSEIAESNGISVEKFLLLFSAAVCVPGPIVNLAAAVGTAVSGSVLYGLLAWTLVVTPGVLSLFFVLPVWHKLKLWSGVVNRTVVGLQAAAVGLLVAGTIQLIGASIGLQWMKLAAVIIGMSLQVVWEVEPVWVILLGFAASVLQGTLY